jgi:glyoxylase-like metal-dependent hydrolase (beta-lactamase superfamily II)
MNSDVYRFRIGSFDGYAISDGRFNYPLEVFFANVPVEQVQTALGQRRQPVSQVTTPFTCLLIDTGVQRVLIDTGAGDMEEHAYRLFPGTDHTTSRTGTLVENLRSAGFQPGDVDTVIITHAHPDHVGGTLDPGGGLVFANAEYYIHPDEWAFWTSEAADQKASPALVQIARHNLEPLQDRIIFLEDEQEIVPGIRPIVASGHTPGHTLVSVRSAGEQLLHIVDTALYPLHLEHPAWFPAFDIDPEQALASKQKILDLAATGQLLVFAHHFPPFPNLGNILRHGEAWRWQPLETAAGSPALW